MTNPTPEQVYPAAYVHASSLLDQLAHLPDLAAEVYLTREAHNPSDQPERRTGGFGSKPPLDLTAYDLLRLDDKGLLASLAMCVRMVFEEADDGTLPDWPRDDWAGVCGWLHATYDTWTRLDCAEDVAHDVRHAWNLLHEAARLPTKPRYTCPECSERMTLMEGGGWFLCDAGHQVEAVDFAQLRRRDAMTCDELCEMFPELKAGTLRQWRARGKVKPADEAETPLRFFPWDVYLLLHPDTTVPDAG